jgi:hypothetical protein
MTERKRRKWDVAAPQGIPLAGSTAGVAGGSSNGMAGFIALQGTAATAASVVAPTKPGQPLDANTIARAQQGAAAIVAKLNMVRLKSKKWYECQLCFLQEP